MSLTGSDASNHHAGTSAQVIAFLHDHGATDQEIQDAISAGMVDLLVADKLFLPGGPRYTILELCNRAGVDIETIKSIWRALGFTDVGDDEKVFTELDIDAAKMIREMMDNGVVDRNDAVGMARVIGSSMARIAEAEILPSMPTARFYKESDDQIAEAYRIAGLAVVWMPTMGKILEYVWRRHLQDALRRAMLVRVGAGEGSSPVFAVGFADMVGFTMLSEHLDEEELSSLISRFEQVSHDVVAAAGGRVVKMIGDEVMFVADSPFIAANIGVMLAEAYADDDMLTDVRVGISYGSVLVHEGDYFGSVVNMASRIVETTSPGTVTVSSDLARALTADPEFNSSDMVLRQIRPRNLKGIGRTSLWALSRHGTEPLTFDRWLAARFEKLADVGHNIDELRERGEQLLARGRLSILTGVGAKDAEEEPGNTVSEEPEEVSVEAGPVVSGEPEDEVSVEAGPVVSGDPEDTRSEGQDNQ